MLRNTLLATSAIVLYAGSAHAQVASTQAVLGSMGVNTHIDFQNYGYQNLATTAAAINYLGVKTLRDDPQNPADVGANGWWQQIANATGAKFDAFLAEGSVAQMQGDLGRAQQLAGQGIVSSLEGGNEEDDPYATSNGNSLQAAAAFQNQVCSVAGSLGLPAINMSFGQGWTAANNWAGNYGAVGNLASSATYANAHTYPQGAPASSVALINTDAAMAASGRPVVQTEFGYDTSSTSPTDAAKWTVDGALDAIAAGDPATYFYALFDDGSGKFGLMNSDGTPKPAGTAVHNLTSILAGGSGSFTAAPLNYSLSGLPSTAHTLLMQKGDRSYDLAIWDESGATSSATLSAAGLPIAVFDPVAGSAPVSSGSGSASFSLGANPVIVQIGQDMRPAAGSTGASTALVLPGLPAQPCGSTAPSPTSAPAPRQPPGIILASANTTAAAPVPAPTVPAAPVQPAAPTGLAGGQCDPHSAQTGALSVQNGQIVDQSSGNPWHGYGVGIYDDSVASGGAKLAQTVLADYPGLNLVRVANYTFGDPASYSAFVSAMAAAHVLIVFENHDTANSVYTGSKLQNESNWYASMAQHYSGNPYVAFQTMNEPGANDAQQMLATYNAVRSHSQALVFIEAGSGADGNPGTLGNASVVSGMHNVAWDMHAYNWQSGYSPDMNAIVADMDSRIDAMQTIRSADGVMPVITLETGNATNGKSLDPGGANEVQAAYTGKKLAGATAWIWSNPSTAAQAIDSLTDGGSLTSYGQEVVLLVSKGYCGKTAATPGPGWPTLSVDAQVTAKITATSAAAPSSQAVSSQTPQAGQSFVDQEAQEGTDAGSSVVNAAQSSVASAAQQLETPSVQPITVPPIMPADAPSQAAPPIAAASAPQVQLAPVQPVTLASVQPPTTQPAEIAMIPQATDIPSSVPMASPPPPSNTTFTPAERTYIRQFVGWLLGLLGERAVTQ